MTHAFCFGLKFWPQLEINETSNFSQTNAFGDKIGYLFTVQEILYFYNLDVNSYLTEFLEEI